MDNLEILLAACRRFVQAVQADCFDEDLMVDIYHDMRDAMDHLEDNH